MSSNFPVADATAVIDDANGDTEMASIPVAMADVRYINNSERFETNSGRTVHQTHGAASLRRIPNASLTPCDEEGLDSADSAENETAPGRRAITVIPESDLGTSGDRNNRNPDGSPVVIQEAVGYADNSTRSVETNKINLKAIAVVVFVAVALAVLIFTIISGDEGLSGDSYTSGTSGTDNDNVWDPVTPPPTPEPHDEFDFVWCDYEAADVLPANIDASIRLRNTFSENECIHQCKFFAGEAWLIAYFFVFTGPVPSNDFLDCICYSSPLRTCLERDGVMTTGRGIIRSKIPIPTFEC